MFGYVTVNPAELTQAQRDRYQGYYCGLCRTLAERHGAVGRVTLSYDMTFLMILLSSLYEPDETVTTGRCLPHPIRARERVRNELCDYCADMNIALAYHKCRDDWQDDRSLAGRLQARTLEKPYAKVSALYPDKCRAIEDCLHDIGALEHAPSGSPDAPANLTARMLGEIYAYRDDYWSPTLRVVGESLGRFVYLMDAYDDLPADLRRKRFNPLAQYRDKDDYEAFCKESLTLLIAECTRAFEELPLVRDVELMRNILYSGVWTRYMRKQGKPDREQGKLKESDHEQRSL